MSTQYVIPTHADEEVSNGTLERVQISVNVHANIVTANKAQKAANLWLLMNAGNLLGVDNPELLLGETLQWRFDVSLSLPNLDVPGTGSVNRIGHICVDALSGEVVTTDNLIEELTANADALTPH